jgi:hypothetical protein
MLFQYKENGQEQRVDCGDFKFQQNVVYKIVIVYDPTVGATGRLQFYIDGKLINTVTPGIKGTDKLFLNSWVGRSSYTWDACINADYFSLKMYNGVIPVNQISL